MKEFKAKIDAIIAERNGKLEALEAARQEYTAKKAEAAASMEEAIKAGDMAAFAAAETGVRYYERMAANADPATVPAAFTPAEVENAVDELTARLYAELIPVYEHIYELAKEITRLIKLEAGERFDTYNSVINTLRTVIPAQDMANYPLLHLYTHSVPETISAAYSLGGEPCRTLRADLEVMKKYAAGDL